MGRIGIMQGRLLPPYPGRFQCFPRDNWALEFRAAQAAGLGCIEWIVDGFGLEDNPMLSPGGTDAIRSRSAVHGVAVRSICADFFMEQPLVRATPWERDTRLDFLGRLLRQAGDLGVQRVVLPFVDASRIDTAPEFEEVVATLGQALELAEAESVELHLESSLDPSRFARLLDRLDHRLLRVNYDSGNSASLGYSVREEFAAYGDHIGSVHIKDRVLGGGTVPLGTGNTDFPALWEALRDIAYGGDFILQTARGPAGEEVDWAARNRAFLESGLNRHGVENHEPRT